MAVKIKKTEDCILVIDAGTQSIRSALIDLKGDIREMVKTPIEPYFSKHPGWAEQRPEYYWKTLCATTKKLLKISSLNLKAVQCVTVTTQRGTVINLDKNGRPLRPAITWLDQRRADPGKWPPLHLRALFKAVNLFEASLYAYCETESNWI